MEQGRKKRPTDMFFALGLAQVAQVRGAHDVAAERFAALRKRFPGATPGYVFGPVSLLASERLEEAEVIAQQGMKLFPDEIGVFLRYAEVAVRWKDWNEAVRRWQIIQDKFSDRAFGYVGRARAFIEMGRYDDADEVLLSARFRLPTEAGIQAELARCAQSRGDVPEATARWKRLLERFPLDLVAIAFPSMKKHIRVVLTHSAVQDVARRLVPWRKSIKGYSRRANRVSNSSAAQWRAFLNNMVTCLLRRSKTSAR